MNPLREFLKLEAAAGVLLLGATVFALVCTNTGLATLYDALLGVPVEIRVGAAHIAKPILLWINDGLMAVFFLLVGLEIKREVYDGELSNREQILLPLACATGGMAVPAIIYSGFNLADPVGARGWAIPVATDIAFALAAVSLLGRRVPVALKVFLTAVAIFDDIGAIVIIAIFHTADLSFWSLGFAAVGLLGLVALNLAGVTRPAPYVLLGVFVWVCVLKSGVHATLAGVALGLAIPLRGGDASHASALRNMEHVLHPWVAYMIVPLFGFANAGIAFAGIGLGDQFAPISLGIALGLIVGKPIGVFGTAWLLIRAGFARLPAGVTWPMLLGGAALCGIGFTMSLFIGTLAFEHAPAVGDGLSYSAATRIGVFAGSLMSGVLGYILLARACRDRTDHQSTTAEERT